MSNTQTARIDVIINGTAANATIRDLGAAARQARAQLHGMMPGTQEFADAAANFQRINGQLNNVRVQAGLTASSFDRLMQNVRGVFIGTLGSNLAEAGITKIFTAFQNGIKTFKEFESSLRVLKSLTGLDGAGMDYLRDSALKTSTQLGVTSKDVVDAYRLIAGAKPELLNNAEALAAITKEAITLAKASGLDLPDASKRLVDALNQFSAPAEEAGKYVNVLAEAARLSAAEVPDITSALLEFGTAAYSAKVGIEGSVAAIETLAEKGLKGAEAGTKLRNVLLVLNAPEVLDKKALNYFKEYGVNMDVLKDKSLPLADRLKELSKIQADAGAISSVFGKENSIAAEILLTSTKRVAELTKALSKDGLNSAQEQATENTKTLANQISRMGIAWDNIMAKQGAIGSFLGFIAEKVTNLIISIDNMGSSIDLMFGGVATASQKTKEYLIDFGKTETGKPLQQFMNLFDKMSDTKFLDNIKKNKETFIDLMKKEGESVKDASAIFDAYENKRRRMYKSPKTLTTPVKENDAENPVKDIKTAEEKAEDKKREKQPKKLEDETLKRARALGAQRVLVQQEMNKMLMDDQKAADPEFLKEVEDLENDMMAVKKTSALTEIELNREKNKKLLDQLQQYAGLATSVANGLANYLNAQNNVEEARNRKKYNDEANRLRKQLADKVITQEQYNTKIAALDAKEEARERAAKKRQAESQKTFAVFTALIQTTLAWVEAYLLPHKIPQAIAASAQAAILLATPIPEFFDGGYTGNGGNLDNNGGFLAKLHKHEYVVNREKMQDPRVQQMVDAIETGRLNNITNNNISNSSSGSSNAKLEQLLEHLINNGINAEMVFDDERMSKFNTKQAKKIIQDDLLSI